MIRGILIVSLTPLEEERDPNEELGHLLRNYREDHPDGRALNKTLPEHDVQVGPDRRRADRVIWAGLGRPPKRKESPTILVEFVSAGRRSRQRDYEEKREEYLGLGVTEYWIIDRFRRTMTVYTKSDTDYATKVLTADDGYSTDLLPGFELPLGKLFELSDDWDD